MFRVILLSLMLFATCATAQLQTEEFWTDWPTISVSKELKEPVSLKSNIQWSLDCSLDSGELIGKISAAAPGSNGRILLLDEQLTQVLVMSPTGQIERTFGQPGEGPGDLPGAYRTFELSDGRFGVCGGVEAPAFLLGGSGKIVLLNERAEPAGQWNGIGDQGTMLITTIRELRCALDNVLVASGGGIFNEGVITQIQEIAVIDPEEGARTVIAKREIIDDMKSGKIIEGESYDPYSNGRCDISNTGRVAFAPERDLWLVVICNSDGTGLVLKQEWNQLKRTKAKKNAIWEDMGGVEACVALDYEPAIARVRWRPNGNLWVEPFGAELREGALVCFDEYSSTGEYLRRIRIEVPDFECSDELVILEDGRFVLLRGFEDNAEDGETIDQSGEVILLEILE